MDNLREFTIYKVLTNWTPTIHDVLNYEGGYEEKGVVFG